jgi:hypothetical protein
LLGPLERFVSLRIPDGKPLRTFPGNALVSGLAGANVQFSSTPVRQFTVS